MNPDCREELFKKNGEHAANACTEDVEYLPD